VHPSNRLPGEVAGALARRSAALGTVQAAQLVAMNPNAVDVRYADDCREPQRKDALRCGRTRPEAQDGGKTPPPARGANLTEMAGGRERGKWRNNRRPIRFRPEEKLAQFRPISPPISRTHFRHFPWRRCAVSVNYIRRAGSSCPGWTGKAQWALIGRILVPVTTWS
jgi:hypothetical protein